MTIDQIIHEAKKLSRSDQYRVVQELVGTLAEEETLLQQFVPGGVYEVWSPYDAGDAALAMMEALAAYEAEHWSNGR
jgi:hypothetical protein